MSGAYNAVVNPLFVNAPIVAELMPTASNLKSSFSRAQLALLPPTPADAINIVIPEVYANIKTDINAPPVRFLKFNTSFATVVGGPLTETILGFGTDEMFQNMCDAKTVYMDGTFSICPKQFYQFFTLHFFAVNSRRLLPAVYFLLTSKTESLYTKLFNMVKAKAAEMGIQIRWDSSMSDFIITKYFCFYYMKNLPRNVLLSILKQRHSCEKSNHVS